MDLYTAIGLGGVGFYVASYGLVQIGKMDGNGVVYSVMNVIAASMVLVSLFQDFNLASMVTQVTWIAVGVMGLALRARRNLQNPGADPIATEGESVLAVVGTASTEPPPADEVGGETGPRLRTRPNLAERKNQSRATFNLRPDTAPVKPGRSTLGLQVDLAPAS